MAVNTSAERGRGLLRALDRWVGTPVLATLGLLRPKRRKPASFQSIGICVFAAIGDALLASALIGDLKRPTLISKSRFLPLQGMLRSLSSLAGGMS